MGKIGFFSVAAATASAISQGKKAKKIARAVANSNMERRNVREYHPSDIEGFFDLADPVSCAIISGGENELRSRAVLAAAICAFHNGYPVIVLHEGNRLLEHKIYQTFSPTNNYAIVNQQNPMYDPFINLTNNELSRLVINSAPKNREIRQAGAYYLDGMAEYLRGRGIPTYGQMYLTCPHTDLINRVDRAYASNQISDATAQQIKGLIMQGQSERASIEAFFLQLDREAGAIMPNNQQLHTAVNIRSAIDYQGLLMIDIVSTYNTILVNLIANELIESLARGKKALLIVDSVSLSNSEPLTRLARSKTTNCPTTISSEDLFATLGGDETLFSTIVGNSSKIVLFFHRSNLSSNKWADVIGYYDKAEISESHTRNRGFQFGISATSGTTLNVSPTREHIIKPEEISRMAANEVYVYDGLKGELAHTTIR